MNTANWRQIVLVALALGSAPFSTNAQQKSPEETYRQAYGDLIYMMAYAKAEGMFIAMTKMGKVPEPKARILTDLVLKHDAKYDVECHMASLKEYSAEIRNAAYRELQDGGQYVNLMESLTVLWTPFVSDGSEELKSDHYRMQEAAKKSKDACLREKQKLLEVEMTKAGI